MLVALAGDRIVFDAGLAGATISLQSDLPPIGQNLTIDGSGAADLAIDGNGARRAFWVDAGTVEIASLKIANVGARGGNGGYSGGGGGLGAGGAVFVNSGAAVTLSRVQIDGSQAAGGDGGNTDWGYRGGGGGGLSGDGGHAGVNGGSGGGPNGGSGAPNATGIDGGDGGFGSGGGGGAFYFWGGTSGGDGGFGGGGGAGGGGDGANGGVGGAGGFGGGGAGGGGAFGASGSGGKYGGAGGTSTVPAGGGGAALGGALFVREGGSLVLKDTDLGNSSVVAGPGGESVMGGFAENGQALGGAIFLHGENLEIEVSQGHTATIGDAIADDSAGGGTASSLTKSGEGELVLGGANTYAGMTTVDDGRLVVNGSLAGDVTVNANGELGGSGTIAGEVTSMGRLAAGNSIGTQTFGGNLATGGDVEVEIDDAGVVPGVNNDLYDVAGDVTITGGTVEVVSAPGTYAAGTRYTFLTYGGTRTGTFAGIMDELSFYDATLFYDDPDQAIGFELQAIAASFAAIGSTENQISAGAYLDAESAGATGDLATAIAALQLMNDAQIQTALDETGGEIYPTLATAQLQRTSQSLSLLRQQLAMNLPCLRGDETLGWVRGYGLGGDASGDGNASGFSYGLGGTEVGIQRCLGDGFAAGAFCDFSSASLALDDVRQSGQVESYQFGVSLQRLGDYAYTLGLVGGGFQDYEVDRTIASLNRQGSSKFDGSQAFVYLEEGTTFDLARSLWQPYASLQYVHLRQSSFEETGAGAMGLVGDDLEADSLRSGLGLSVERSLAGARHRWTPSLRASWMHEFLDTRQSVNTSLSGAGSGAGAGFTTHGVDLGRDWAVTGAGLRMDMTSNVALFGGYDLQFNSRQTLHTGNGGVEVTW